MVFIRFLKKWWWTLLLGVATVLSFIGGALLFGARKREETNEQLDVPKPTFKERAATQIEHVRLEGEIERARIETRHEERVAEIKEIEEIGKENPAEARKRLAEWLTNNL